MNRDYKSNSSYGNNRSYPQNNRYKEKKSDPLEGATPVNRSLAEEYGKRPEIFLQKEYLYTIAENITNLKTHQVRKVLSVVKESLAIAKSNRDFQEARKRLFVLLPMIAYNTGRAGKKEKPEYEELFRFVYENVNQHSIQSKEDIEMFDQMVTAVVAYHKYLGGKD